LVKYSICAGSDSSPRTFIFYCACYSARYTPVFFLLVLKLPLNISSVTQPQALQHPAALLAQLPHPL